MIFSYIYDFISFVFEREIKDKIKNIILYGSVASGEFDEESDVDIFVEVWDKNEKSKIEEKIKEQINKFEEIASRKWHPRGITNNFSIIVGNLEDEKWENLKHDIISNGILLYGKFERLPENKKHKVIMNFSLEKLNQKKKMKFIRKLYGYKTKTEKKKYQQKGLLEKNKGEKLSSNCILVPIEKVKIFRNLFNKYKLTPEVREIWLNEE